MRADPPIGAVTDVPDAIRAGAQIRPLCVTQSSGHAEVLKNVRNGCLTRPEHVSEEEGLVSVKWTLPLQLDGSCAEDANRKESPNDLQ